MTATTAAASVPTTSHTKRSTPSELSKTCGAGASGRRGEEVQHLLGLVYYMSGQFEEAYSTFEAAREPCAKPAPGE